jgi:hypothetical protein
VLFVKNNIKPLLILPIILFASLFVIPSLPSVHASGLVCLGPNGSVTCPTPPVSIPATAGSSVRVAVVVSGSSALSGYDITLLADHAFLVPTGVDLTGSVVTASTPVVECLQGVLVAGSTCVTTDTIDTLHFAAIGNPTSGATTGLLFTAIYKVVASTAGADVGYQTGCTGSASVPGVCVNVVLGGNSIPETTPQGATVSTPDFLASASPNPIIVSAGGTGTSTITLTSVGGYGDFVDLAVTSTTPAISASVSGSPVDLVSSTTNTATLSVGPASTGTYTVVVTATGEGVFSTVVPSHAVTVTVEVGSPDFTVSATPSSVNIPAGTFGTTTVNVGSLAGFAGMVSVSATSPAGITATPSPSTVTAPGSFALTITVAGSVAPGSYTVTETGTSGSLTHSAAITVVVGTKGISVNLFPGNIGVFRGASAAAQITVTSVNNFAGTVGLTISITNTTVPDSAGSTNVPTSINPTSVVLVGGDSKTSTLIIFAPLTVATGFYMATITGASGTTTGSGILFFNVEDFSMTPQYSTVTVTNQTGIISHDVITVTSLGGLNAEGAALVAATPSAWYPGTPAVPVQRTLVPALGQKLCLLDTFYPNGTQIPFSVLRLTGPIAWVGETTRCGRNDGNAFPLPGTPDVFVDQNGVAGPQIQVLSNTAPGLYTVKLIAIYGLLTREVTFKVNVIQAPIVHQLAQFSSSLSFSASGGKASFKVGITSPGASNVYVNIQLIAVGSNGQFASGTSGTFKVNGGGNANNIPITIPLKMSAIGGTFSLQAIITVGLSPDALTGTSILNNISGSTFTVTP